MATTTATTITVSAGGVTVMTGATNYSSSLVECASGATTVVAVDDMSRAFFWALGKLSTGTVTLKVQAGNYSDKGLGERTYSLLCEATVLIGPLESARYKATSGNVVIYATGGSATVGYLTIEKV